MIILEGKEYRERDIKTITNQGISSLSLMKHAAHLLSNHLLEFYSGDAYPVIYVFCGNGNNGGDGLLMAKNLLISGRKVEVYIIDAAQNSSPDFISALGEIKESFGEYVNIILDATHFPEVKRNGLIVDALLGCGINKPLTGLCAQLIEYLNNQPVTKISIDLPSGMHADFPNYTKVFRADEILTIQDWKASFFYKESASFIGKITIIDIGLDDSFASKSKRFVIDQSMISTSFTPRKKYSHKGNFGHGLLIAGSPGMMGASLLAAKSTFASGIGKLTVGKVGATDDIIIAVPEAMSVDIQDFKLNIQLYNGIAIGPGIGQTLHMSKIVDGLLNQAKSCTLVLDADALNIIAQNKWQSDIPKNAILTPHPKEFTRLFGEVKGHYEMVELQKKMSILHGIYIILKTAHTTVTSPSGDVFYNTTGNPGMAKAGSGDVLTGLLLGYSCWMKSPLDACLAAVYNHGWAGDLAKDTYGELSMTPSNIIEKMAEVHKNLSNNA